MFAIAALLDEVAMSLPDLRPLWANHPLQATRWMTNNAGVELFQRLERVRKGPRTVFATYVTVLGLGFQGRFGLPGADRYALAQLRRELSHPDGRRHRPRLDGRRPQALAPGRRDPRRAQGAVVPIRLAGPRARPSSPSSARSGALTSILAVNLG